MALNRTVTDWDEELMKKTKQAAENYDDDRVVELSIAVKATKKKLAELQERESELTQRQEDVESEISNLMDGWDKKDEFFQLKTDLRDVQSRLCKVGRETEKLQRKKSNCIAKAEKFLKE